jgi:hypothetical protein
MPERSENINILSKSLSGKAVAGALQALLSDKTSVFGRAAILILAEQLYADKAELIADALEVLKQNALDTEAATDALEVLEKEAAFGVEQVLQKEAAVHALQVLAEEEVYAVKAEKAAADKAAADKAAADTAL